MSASHITFTGAIRETAKALGRVASDDAVARLNSAAQGLAEVDREAGTVAIRHAPDRVEPFADWMRREVGRWPTPTPEKLAQPSRWTGLTAAAAAAGVASRIKAQDDADALAHARALANGPNPFRPGGNMTHRTIIAHRLPDVAVKLKAQAK